MLHKFPDQGEFVASGFKWPSWIPSCDSKAAAAIAVENYVGLPY